MSEQQQVLAVIRLIIKYAAFILAVGAFAKFMGFNQIPGDVQTMALVAIALGTTGI